MKKRNTRVLSLSVAFCMTFSIPFTYATPITAFADTAVNYEMPVQTVDVNEGFAVPGEDDIDTYSIKVPSNAIYDTWANPNGNDAAVNEVYEQKYLHIKSGAKNQHESSVAGNPNSVFVNQEAGTFEDGTVEMTFFAGSAPANTRAGIFTRYNAGKGIFVGYDNTGWFYQIYDGKENPYDSSGVAALASGEQKTLSVTLQGNEMTASLDGQDLFGKVDVSTLSGTGSLAIKAASWGAAVTDICVKDISYPNQKMDVVSGAAISGRIVDKSSNPISGAAVKLGSKNTTTGDDGSFKIEQRAGEYDLTVSKEDYKSTTQKVTVADADSNIGDIVLQPVNKWKLTSSDMIVTVDEDFPRVIEYNMKGKVFDGQRQGLNQVTINGVDIVPSSITSNPAADKITYEIPVKVEDSKDTSNNVDAVLTAEISVEADTLTFQITNVEVNSGIVKTIEIKNHNLISVNSNQTDAKLQGTETLSVNVHKTGDHEVIVDKDMNVSSEAKRGYLYAFVSNNQLSAGLWSNSENKVSSDWQRVTATAQENNGVKTVGLSSTYWTYQKDENHRAEDGTIEYTTGANSDGQDAVAIDELPCAKVVITPDINGDSVTDWQDGAIAYRKIMNNPLHYERVKDLAAYRIAMNFGSQAQNPFLMTLDNVKKVYLNTDGLGQSILLKGYGSEGHDSGHLNYADIGTRLGGAEDMKTLLDKGAELGATFGIHVNASETYPESIYFRPEILKKDKDGNYSYGWNWIDQGINIDADYDLTHGRVDRWKELYDELGGKDNKLDFIYVDVWGNGQSGDNGSWASRQLAKEITGHNWRLAGEWGYANEYDSTFQHWAADLTYGGYNLKGINSTIARFIRNHQKDSWVGNYPSYGGRAETPLLGGMNMKDFEGWQGRSDYAAYINNLYEVNLSSKFIQHFEVTNWKDGNPVTMTDNGETYQWTPGMEAKLKAKIKGKDATLEIKRLSNDYANDKDNYRSREMKLDGRVIFEGQEGDSSYLIPWYWDADGDELDTEKLYHWNSKGGETTWDVPAGWTGNLKVYELNELGKQNEQTIAIQNGKVTLNAKASTPYVAYLDGKVVETKKITWSDGMHLTDTGFNSGTLDYWTIKGDTVSASITKSNGSNPMLTFQDNKEKTTVTQELTDLKPNTKYAAYVGIDNRSKAEAGISVTANGKTISNSSGESIARNYVSAYAHNTNKATSTVDGTSYFQNMYVFFETGADGKAELTLSREAGTGASYFDDVRVCENNSENWAKWEKEGIFTQDFENVAQGIYPFVVGNLEGVTDNRTHLAELHAPYTQRGWNEKVVSDVIDGKWSIKTNGLVGYDNLVYQTIPQNFKFEPGQSYMVQFDYEAGSDDTYSFVAGDGDYLEKGVKTNVGLASTASNPSKNEPGGKKTVSFNIVGAEDGQSWIGIYSNDVASDTQGTTNSGQVNFNGYNDFMLDNLTIVKSESNKENLWNVIQSVQGKIEAFYTAESWTVFTNALSKATEVYEKLKATQAEVDQAEKDLQAAFKGLKEVTVTKTVLSDLIAKCEKYQKEDYSKSGWTKFLISLNYAKAATEETSPRQELLQKAFKELILAELELAKDSGPETAAEGKDIASDNFNVSAGSIQEGASGEGPAEYALDNDPGTIWHTDWNGTDRENMWIGFDLKNPETVDGLRYMRRQGGGNGEIFDYEIKVSKDNGKTFTTAASGKFESDDKWQNIEFAAIEGVTNVRLYAVTSKNEYASAAEVRITGPAKEDQQIPQGIKASEADAGESNGKITGVTSLMEYSTIWNEQYKNCPDTEITGLAAGDYFVRYAGNATKNASIPVKVTVFEKEKSNGGGGNSGGSSSSDSTDTVIPDVTNKNEPQIVGKDGKTGWDAIKSEIKDAIESGLKQQTKQTVTIDMNEAVILPKAVLLGMQNNNIDVIFKVGALSWKINGKQIKSADADVSLAVKKLLSKENKEEVKVITDVLAKQADILKVKNIRQISQVEIAQKGKLPFQATVTVPVNRQFNKDKVFVSYYNEKTKQLELVDYRQVNNGTVSFIPVNGGRYVVTTTCPVKPSITTASSVKKGEAVQLNVSNVLRKGGVFYSVDNKKIASVSKDGKLTAKDKGKVKVTVTVKQAGKTYKMSKQFVIR